jgi:phospholipid/cholesterol/gamma-HCH transport system substrate-binding protein
MERRVLIVRVAALAGLIAALAALGVLLAGGGTYRVTAKFRDAGQLVKGANVQVAGRAVGTIADISLSDDGLAAVELELDSSVEPLHRGTRARIRTVGLSGIANRFVDLDPGPDSAPEIPDGGELGLTETQGIVDLDAVLSSLDPRTRDQLRSLLRNGGKLFADGAARDLNRALRFADPATQELGRLTAELTRDRAALGRLLQTGATTAGVLADERDAVAAGLEGTAATLRAVATEQAALGRLLVRAPQALRTSARSLDRIGTGFDRIRPALGELAAATPALAATLRALPPTARAARPVLRDLAGTLPALNVALGRLPGLARVAVPAVRSTTSALLRLQPILEGLRPYAPDVAAGLGNGFGGGAANAYDANGHLARIELQLSSAAGGLAGLLNSGGGSPGPGGTLVGGLTARCPGAAAPLLPDASNPFPDGNTTCDREAVRR